MPYFQYNTEQFWFYHSQMLIGSSEANTFTIKGKGVNPSHALIEEHQGAFWISGINRLSNIFINGKKIKRQVLQDQDMIVIGDQSFTYHLYVKDILSRSSQTHSETLQAYQRLYEFYNYNT